MLPLKDTRMVSPIPSARRMASPALLLATPAVSGPASVIPICCGIPVFLL